MNFKIDVLYVFNYEEPFFKDALERLKCSLISIHMQDVRICVFNYSSQCILKFITDVKVNVKYKHIAYDGPFSRALLINHAVKNLIETPYFLVSDVDVVYSMDHIQRIKNKIKVLSLKDEKIRLVTYNYNIAPVYKNFFYHLIYKIPYVSKFIDQDDLVIPHLYTHEYIILDQFRKEVSGYAHGLGLIHTESFLEINGFDEELIGYGPEDVLFNIRIGKINRLIYDNLPDTATLHLWHPKFHRIQVSKNLNIFNERKQFYDTLVNPTIGDIQANKGKSNWGVL
jgi:predicted glycosyltransferase involved in capsule biosynthesis